LYLLHQVMDERLFLCCNSSTWVQTASLLGFRNRIQLNIPHSVELLW